MLPSPNQEGICMSDGETAYLAMVIVGFVVFTIALAWVSASDSRRVR